MNQARTNNRADRFDALTQSIAQKGRVLGSPQTQEVQVVVTRGVIRLLGSANNGYYPNLRSSNPKDTWNSAQFFSDGATRIRINGLGARGTGPRVSQIIGLGPNPEPATQEEIEAMILSLRYPFLDPNLVKAEHRKLLNQYGYLK